MASITCPKCGETIIVNASEICSIINQMREEFEKELAAKTKEYTDKIAELEARITELAELTEETEEELDEAERAARHYHAQAVHYRNRPL